MKPIFLAPVLVASLLAASGAVAGVPSFPTLPVLTFPDAGGPNISTQDGPKLPLILPSDD